MSFTVNITNNKGITAEVTTKQIVLGSFSLEDLSAVVNGIPAIEQFCVYANRGSEVEALTPIKGSINPVNFGASFDNDGFTGNGASAYINSRWMPRLHTTWATQMWCGWVKGLNSKNVGALVGFSKYIDPNYFSFLLSHRWNDFVKKWIYSFYDNNFLPELIEEGTSNDTDSSDYPMVDSFIVYQWTDTDVELWINGRLLGKFSLNAGSGTNMYLYEFAENGEYGASQYSTATLGMSGYGQFMSKAEIETMYEASKAYINKGKEAIIIGTGDAYVENSDQSYSASVGVGNTLVLPDINIIKNDDSVVTRPASIDLDLRLIDPCTPTIPTGWDEQVAAYGRGFNYPPPTGQTTPYRTGDDAYIEDTIFAPIRQANSLRVQNSLIDFFTLSNNNSFGNTDRFTDINGLQVYGDNYVIDNYTGLGWYRIRQASTVWNTAIDSALASTQNGYTDWFMCSWNQLSSISNKSASISWLTGYPPFNVSSVIQVSTSSGATTVNYITTLNQFRSSNKTNAFGYLICRKHF